MSDEFVIHGVQMAIIDTPIGKTAVSLTNLVAAMKTTEISKLIRLCEEEERNREAAKLDGRPFDRA